MTGGGGDDRSSKGLATPSPSKAGNDATATPSTPLRRRAIGRSGANGGDFTPRASNHTRKKKNI